MECGKTAAFISKILYPKCNPIWFILYMYFKYYSVLKRKTKYFIVTISDDILWKFVRNHNKLCCDINNTILVHPSHIYPSDRLLLLTRNSTDKHRKVFVVPNVQCEKDRLYISNTLFYNAFFSKKDSDVRLSKPLRNVEFAQEIELSLVASPHDLNNALVDKIIEGYFTLPKIIYKGDIVTINIRSFAPSCFYTDPKVNCTQNIYFICNKVIFKESEVTEGYLCAIGETAIKQTANVQSFIPKIYQESVQTIHIDRLTEVDICPYGLQTYLNILDNAVKPFLSSKKLDLRPVFLIQGEEGCGDETIINALASQLGMHHFKIHNCNLSANVYAQNEAKLNNVFFTAKMSTPCIISIDKFQNFGKNSEGQYDQRLINSFHDYLANLFDNNSFPVILFCCSNSKDISSDLKRIFLEIFDISSPTDIEREQILEWILKKKDIQVNNVELKSIANKTHGFFFEDLRTLVFYAETCFHRQNRKSSGKVILDKEHFQFGIDFMQSNYNESLGAPKVPKVQWSDVGGLSDVKEEIIKTINLPLKFPEMFQNSGLNRSGILLFGPPGTGKTLIAKAVATECSLCFLTVKGPELLNMYVGQSEQNVRQVFERARQASPCIIFFDELDSLAPNRGLSGDSGGVMDRVVSQLLAEMDGIESTGKVFIIGATNRPDLIDPALLRPGRFDKLLYVGPCTDLESKLSVLEALTRKFNFSSEVNLKEIVETCPQNITGADFYGICSSAWSSAAKRLIIDIEKGKLNSENMSPEDVVVRSEDFELAIKNVKPSISNSDLKYFENLKKELSSNITGNN